MFLMPLQLNLDFFFVFVLFALLFFTPPRYTSAGGTHFFIWQIVNVPQCVPDHKSPPLITLCR